MNIVSERHPRGAGDNSATTKGKRLLLKRLETKKTSLQNNNNNNNNNNNTQSSAHQQKRVVLKVAVRLLPPLLKESDFFSQVGDYVNDETVDDKYYVPGHYSDIPFQLPIYSRAYILFKSESHLNKFMDYISLASFSNSDGVREEEIYSPDADLAFYEKMDFPKTTKALTPTSPLETDLIFKAFMEWYNIEDPLEKALSKPHSFIKSVAKSRLVALRKTEPNKKQRRSDSKKSKGKETKIDGVVTKKKDQQSKKSKTKDSELSKRPSRQPKNSDKVQGPTNSKPNGEKSASKRPRRPKASSESKEDRKPDSVVQEKSKSNSNSNRNNKGSDDTKASKPGSKPRSKQNIEQIKGKIHVLKKSLQDVPSGNAIIDGSKNVEVGKTKVLILKKPANVKDMNSPSGAT